MVIVDIIILLLISLVNGYFINRLFAIGIKNVWHYIFISANSLNIEPD